ncbi:MAG: biopolymer transporter ExbD [Pirellulaceae bacterium]|jgi:biopolymer transport protein ExbD|nr:biopolymer transporter ExbD [Pirellulaceae bacterium]
MRIARTTKLLVEPPSSATGDIAFNLIVFFLVCASVQPDRGRLQVLPASETVEDKSQQTENIEVQLTRTAVLVNGDAVPLARFEGLVKSLLAQKSSPDQKVVIVKSRPDTPYHHWIRLTAAIEDAGGMITLQLEEEREVVVP